MIENPNYKLNFESFTLRITFNCNSRTRHVFSRLRSVLFETYVNTYSIHTNCLAIVHILELKCADSFQLTIRQK